MNDLITDIKALKEETLLNLKSSKASNTLRAYKSDFKDFQNFCEKYNFSSLPTNPKILTWRGKVLIYNGADVLGKKHFQ